MTGPMKKHFKHPLARSATVAKLKSRDGAEQDCLLIVTTLTLDKDAKDYSAKNVERLHEAAKAFLVEAPDVGGYAIVNRARDWAQ